ncbi:MAG: hypothetical protein K2H81_07745 [Alistipes sp.]|nr:hypothetical protein [Alistipes sp.]
MSALTVVFYIVVVVTTCIRLSFLPVRLAACIAVLWGFVSMGITRCMSGLTSAQVADLLDMNMLVAAEFVELLIFICYLFAPDNSSGVSRYYPGLMLVAPIAASAARAPMLLPGTGFGAISLLAGGATTMSLFVLSVLTRRLGPHRETLYDACLLGVALCVVIFGIL